MFKAAAVEIDITPPIGTMLAGYTARVNTSIGIHDPLKSQILLIDSGDTSALIITMDLLAVQSSFTDRLRASISQKTGIPEKQIMISCSHTHSAPQGFILDSAFLNEKKDDNLLDITIRKITGACIWAKSSLKPAKFSLGHSLGSGVGLNRNDPVSGPSDQQVTILKVEDRDENPIAVLFNYGCHPTIMGSDNLLISADYPGATRKELNNIFPDTIFLFTNSSAGDVSTRFTRKESSFNEVTRLGQILAGSVLRAMNLAEDFKPNEIKASLESVDLPIKKLPTIEETKTIIQTARQEFEELKKSSASLAELRKSTTKIEGAEILMLLVKEFSGKTKMQSFIQIIQIGPISLVGVPGEPFSKTFLDIKEQIKPRQAILIGYANDYKGYFPESSSGQSTYEDFVSPFSSAAAQNIKNTIIKIIKGTK